MALHGCLPASPSHHYKVIPPASIYLLEQLCQGANGFREWEKNMESQIPIVLQTFNGFPWINALEFVV